MKSSESRVNYTFTFTSASPGDPVNFTNDVYADATTATQLARSAKVLDSQSSISVWAAPSSLTAIATTGTGQLVAVNATQDDPTRAEVPSDSGSLSTFTRSFPITFDTPDLLAGADIWTPAAGDVLLDAWLKIDTAWDGTTPQGDLILGGTAGGQTLGMWHALVGQALPMTAADLTIGSSADYFVGPSLSRLSDAAALAYPTSDFDGLYVVSGASVTFTSNPVTSGNRYLPGEFTAATPVKFVVSTTGATTGSDPGSTQGSAVLYLVTVTPVVA